MIEYFVIPISGVLIFVLIKIIKKKPTKNKQWLVFEHHEGYKDGQLEKCYYAKNKKSEIKSPCFSEIRQLNTWTNNAKQVTQKLH